MRKVYNKGIVYVVCKKIKKVLISLDRDRWLDIYNICKIV